MPYLDFLKKFKRFRVFEPSLGVLGFFFLAVCALFCFFYLNFRETAREFQIPTQRERVVLFKLDGFGKNSRAEFIGDDGDGCDVFEGDWVWDEGYPLYRSTDCRFLDVGFKCSENGRPDLFYTKWRWQPRDCNLPRFNARAMLEKMRNKRLAFVGDSIGRNQWESLLCMLSSAVPKKDSIYEVNGRPITKHKGYFVFNFRDYNCSVEYYRAPFLVLQSRPPPRAPRRIKTTLKLDKMDWSWLKWRDADVLVFNTGHWWNDEKTVKGGCYFQEGNQIKIETRVEDAYRKSMETVVKWIHSEVDTDKTRVFFSTFSPVHFRGGSWRTGGHCHLETLPDMGSSLVPSGNWDAFHTIIDALSSSSGTNKSEQDTAVSMLNITGMSARRKDGHSSIYYLGPKTGPAPVHRQDCSHWCLPGVPDAWNELLYAFFLKNKQMER